ncbi:phage portal protein [Mycobacteroides abscessus]|uniref:phage portal protein n=1 Tax=Mycobacteroides abscessus TaxID=36809 RepID=UPI00092AE76A|nr:phage portal protein [Mycobacteroides abscessus]DAZ90339.1 TPA_asm: portal protein [Mycobacterium phage prophiFSQJ01-1]SII41176.1 Phage portal protein, SPP1 Gp6 [Mycobacteroides abscessus subsp. abscessus]SIK13989.1 Phage portal protein, SPP1 Gp6 [Mycobacteroides abscessus subsp. abscessus]SIN25506.1 Phage portal protein, SPP1 Gp6 [Mycobacteroides abscessus subsp. abscessus]SLI51422.1 Phage portal protein, SPP1 Gp6 [Mycobacteroides abscessus subsp. abscessus]
MTVAIALPTLSLSSDELDVLQDLTNQLQKYQPENIIKEQYYEAKRKMDDLKIAIPPSLSTMLCCVGWPGITVDSLIERLNFEGWSYEGDGEDDDPLGLMDVYFENDLDVESDINHTDGLMYGTSFAAVSSGMDDEPDVLVTVESPRNMTVIYDPRTRRATSGYLQIIDKDDRLVGGRLFLPNETIWLECSPSEVGSAGADNMKVTHRDPHNLNRVLVAQMINRPRTGARGRCGHSEITETVVSLTQSGMRTLANTEVAREYLAAPQRAVLGAKESFFIGEDGKPLPAWKSYIGRMIALERDEYGEIPDIREFKGASLDSFFGQMRTLSQLMSSEIAVPANYLGFETDNPPSADAIRSMEARHVKRAEQRQKTFGRGWTEVGRLAVMVREGKTVDQLPGEIRKVRPQWRDASTPTFAAMTDAVVKLIDKGVFTPTSRVTRDKLGISRADQRQLEIDDKKTTVTNLVSSIRQGVDNARQDGQVASLADRRAPSVAQSG